jgi:hypothetical protein
LLWSVSFLTPLAAPGCGHRRWTEQLFAQTPLEPLGFWLRFPIPQLLTFGVAMQPSPHHLTNCSRVVEVPYG